MTAKSSGTRGTVSAAHAGLWLLPIYAVLLALSSLTHQPDPDTDFEAFARYVTTDIFLASHVLASITGAALGTIGAVAALAFLLRGPAVRAAVAGVVLTITGNVLTTAVFGVAAFAQPALGRAYLNGTPGASAMYDDVYGTPLLATVGVGLLMLIAGAISLGSAIARTDREVHWAGIGYAVFLPLFAVTGFLFSSAQPVAAAALAVAAVVIAIRLPRVTARELH